MSNYKHGGYDHKYVIKKRSGKPVDPRAEYFVLRLDKDPHALKAMETYIHSVIDDNPELAHDLAELIELMYKIQGHNQGDKRCLKNTKI